MPARSPPPDDMSSGVNFLWSHALSPATLAVYKSALTCFLTFVAVQACCAPWSVGSLPIIDEDILIAFVTYCQLNLSLRYDTIKLYLAGIRYHYVKEGSGDPLASALRLPYILRAINRTQDNSSRKQRLPLTFPIVSKLCAHLKSGMFDPFTDTMLTCCFHVAFYGFLRCGEFTCKSPSDTFIRLQDIAFASDFAYFSMHLRSSKTDPFRKGISILIFENGRLSPVASMSNFLALRRQQGAEECSPLFVESGFNFKPLSRRSFLSLLKRAISRIGLDDRAFSGHSFRSGAATSCAAGGVEDHLVKVLGRWSSDCYTRYVRPAPASLREAQLKMNYV